MSTIVKLIHGYQSNKIGRSGHKRSKNSLGQGRESIILAGLICILAVLGSLQLAQAQYTQTGQITLVTESFTGSGISVSRGGIYGPYYVNTNVIEWRIDNVDIANKESLTYLTDIHLAGTRSCATQVQVKDLSWSDIQGRIFKYEFYNMPGGSNQDWTSMTGDYYIGLRAHDSNGVEVLQERLYVYIRVPPINSYNIPYTPPADNNLPVPVGEIVNGVSGSGRTWSDPIMINGPIVQFRIDGSYDPDGTADLVNGVFHWGIVCPPHHPVYGKVEGERDPAKTYLYYEEIQDTVFEWDTNERPTDDGRYQLHVMVFDQFGERDLQKLHFRTSDLQCSCTPWEDQGCGQGSCPSDQMYQTRICDPSGCATESRCVSTPVCTSVYEKEDINQDGEVDLLDIQICTNVYLKFEMDPIIVTRADVNGDGEVNALDIQIILNVVSTSQGK